MKVSTMSKLFVGNLDFDAQEDEVRELFGQFGAVVSVKIVLDRETGRPRGFGFVEYQSASDANRAISELDGRDFHGRSLRINQAEDRRGAGRPPSGPRRTDGW